MTDQENSDSISLLHSLKKWGKRCFLVLCVLGMAVLYYGCWEAKQVEYNEVHLPAQVMPGMSSLRIGVVGDIHYQKERVEDAVKLLQHQKPDIILIVGDFVTADKRASRMGEMAAVLNRLVAIAPTYACLGNHDMEKLELVQRMLSKTSIKLLRNQSDIFHVERLHKDMKIVGLGDWTECDCEPEACLQHVGDEGVGALPVLLLCHNPSARHALKDELGFYQWNLMVSGHTHGGQLRAFKKQAFFIRDGEFLTEGVEMMPPVSMPIADAAGVQSESVPGYTPAVFVTRGVGTVFGMRFNCPPEVNMIIID